MAERIKIRISPDGSGVTTEGVNCLGDVCRKLSKPFEDALGTIESTSDKPELHVQPDFEGQNQTVEEE